ncbi:hypothetical protein BAX51_01065 [Mycoplasmoides gallisepticum]|uniref:Lipoprotein n=1 Tax=Mycoplasmoides gallisepticum TaxID=2096 RepID=A0AB36DS83_MYCGL|nr:hypothetical protein [Mycoplasmoides gallisepticum]OBU78422.1 hypothetical protein BAY36_03105 [Mycoplasmoides gallisepticum]OBU79345.1 hypothetical protein BAY37_01355 [Mycoplasmoides gallisepticum]OBU80842.1 hypothetical protein BAX53_01455 [Mycoplasmoides gallisepticum]OBU80946.1 hypothetical protein BAX52_00300 [Mycoplasmoides gallisepticum]OBU81155.1 hypothetical protein BAX51_01065 [Mycoplasmoides gallisepticum]
MRKKIFKLLALSSVLAVPLSSCMDKESKSGTKDEGSESNNKKEDDSLSDDKKDSGGGETGESGDKSGSGDSNLNEDQKPPATDESNDNAAIELTLKSTAVVASDLINQQNGTYSLNWTKFNTNISEQKQASATLSNLTVNDREGTISFNLATNDNRTFSFNQTVDFSFENLKSLNFNWTDVKQTTNDASLEQIKAVTNSEQLSEFAMPALYTSSNDHTNYFPYLSKWFIVNLTHQRHSKKLEENEITFQYQLSNHQKTDFYNIKNGSSERQISFSNENTSFLVYPSDLSRAANSLVVNTSSELFNKPIDNFYDTTDGAVKTDELERSVKNGGFVKFTNNDYGTKFDISLVNSTASYNADTRELSFTVQVRSVNDDYHNSRSIQKIFKVTLGKNADE